MSCGTLQGPTTNSSSEAIIEAKNAAVDGIEDPDSYVLVKCDLPPESKSDDIEVAMDLMQKYINGPSLECYKRHNAFVNWYFYVYKGKDEK